MRHFKLIQTTLLFFLGTLTLQAQFAPGVDWYKIETEHFLIIFPREITDDAVRVALKTEEIYKREVRDFDDVHEKRWPLVLTTSGMVSNGYVTLVPRKSVWFGTPSGGEMSALDWYDLLGLHETRHMVQMDTMNKGLIRVLYFLGGEIGLTAGIHLSVPSWFLEGDAVAAETMYSRSGRGREPLFSSQMKILTLDENYSYQKFVNRSFRDYIPNQYVFGYYMTAYIKKKYGEDSWNQILKTASLVPLPALGIYLGAKKITGKSWSRLFDEMMNDLKEQWSIGDALVEVIPNTPVLDGRSDNYSRYETVFADGESVIARKKSMAEPTELVRIADGREESLFRISGEGSVTSDGRRAVWTFVRPSLHNESVSWSDLVVADLDSGQKKIISRRERLLFPSFSPDGKFLAVVNWSTRRSSEIRILETKNWDVVRRYPLEGSGFAVSPSWSEDCKRLLLTIQDFRGLGIFSLDLDTGVLSMIQDFSLEGIKGVFSWKNYILYSSSESGYENLMALDRESDKKYRITSRLYGVEDAWLSVKDSRIYYSDIRDKQGSRIVYQDLNPRDWIPFEAEEQEEPPYSGRGDWSVHDLAAAVKPGEKGPEVEKYSLFRNSWRIHSWGISPNLETMTGLRFQIQSTDIMDTLNIAAGSEYEINEKTWGAFLDADWSPFYPVLLFRNSMTLRNLGGEDLWDGSFRMGFSFPMTFRRDVWYYFINPAVSSGLRVYMPVGGEKAQSYFPLNTGVTAYALLPGSSRAINPDWGIIQRAGGSMNPETPSRYYRMFTETRVYAPGLFRNTSFTLNGALEEQSGQYTLSFPFARGYESGTDFRTVKGAVDFDFPLFYPDLAGGSFFYVSRIRGKFFYDFVQQENISGERTRFQSLGTELIFDMTAANQSQGPFSLGLRYTWLLDEQRLVIQLVFINVSL